MLANFVRLCDEPVLAKKRARRRGRFAYFSTRLLDRSKFGFDLRWITLGGDGGHALHLSSARAACAREIVKRLESAARFP